jgi:histidyl-tRNA synthetase
MDYYNLTVFEWTSPLLGAQGTVCGGGRYDQLIETLGGKPAPGIGFGLGMERLMLMLDGAGLEPAPSPPTAYALVPEAQALPRVMVTLDVLRAQGVSVLMHAGGGSMKSQFKRADASGAAFALVFGADEMAAGLVAIKPLRGDSTQFTRPLGDVASWVHELRTT